MIRKSFAKRIRISNPAARPGCSADFVYWASFRTTAPSSYRRLPSSGDLRGCDKLANLLQVLAGTVAAVGLCLRIDAGRPHCSDRCSHIPSIEAAGQDCRNLQFIGNASADRPVMRTTERANLPVAGI